MKKLTVFLTSMLLFITLCENAFAIAESADCACVINGVTGDVVFSKNISKRHAMASTTKIMTAVIALENCAMDEEVEISANADAQEGSSAYIKAGMHVHMLDLLFGLMLNSGNDAAVAIAEHIAGSSEAFADMMNEKVLELGLRDTHFVNPNGLDDKEHFTTAYDLAIIAKYAMQNPDFRSIVSTKTYQAKAVDSEEILYFKNHNKMLSQYEGATGIKTGYTKATGRCLVSSAMRDDMEFIAVTLCDGNDWNDHKAMLDYAFEEHYPKKVVEEGMTVKTAEIDGKKYNMIAAGDFIVPMKGHRKTTVEVVTHLIENLKAPINAGEKVGYIDIIYDDKSIGTVDILSQSDIMKVNGIRLKDSFFNDFMNVVKLILI